MSATLCNPSRSPWHTRFQASARCLTSARVAPRRFSRSSQGSALQAAAKSRLKWGLDARAMRPRALRHPTRPAVSSGGRPRSPCLRCVGTRGVGCLRTPWGTAEGLHHHEPNHSNEPEGPESDQGESPRLERFKFLPPIPLNVQRDPSIKIMQPNILQGSQVAVLQISIYLFVFPTIAL